MNEILFIRRKQETIDQSINQSSNWIKVYITMLIKETREKERKKTITPSIFEVSWVSACFFGNWPVDIDVNDISAALNKCCVFLAEGNI